MICLSFSFKLNVLCYQDQYKQFFMTSWQVDVSLTELSLDVLLYLVGKLNIAGPYAVRSSKIFTNCCKVIDLPKIPIVVCR